MDKVELKAIREGKAVLLGYIFLSTIFNELFGVTTETWIPGTYPFHANYL